MTPEEHANFLRQLNEAKRREGIALSLQRQMEARRRRLIHEEYKKMGFDIDMENVLSNLPYIPTTAKFVDVDPDFYDHE